MLDHSKGLISFWLQNMFASKAKHVLKPEADIRCPYSITFKEFKSILNNCQGWRLLMIQPVDSISATSVISDAILRKQILALFSTLPIHYITLADYRIQWVNLQLASRRQPIDSGDDDVCDVAFGGAIFSAAVGSPSLAPHPKIIIDNIRRIPIGPLRCAGCANTRI